MLTCLENFDFCVSNIRALRAKVSLPYYSVNISKVTSNVSKKQSDTLVGCNYFYTLLD